MNTDFIKWMCEKAGWKIIGDNILFQDGRGIHIDEIKNDVFFWKKTYYPFLLQRAIEGVNRDHEIEYIIEISDIVSVCYRNENSYVYSRDPSIIGFDQAKESALKYIYDQERT
jgi:signal peptidase I